jgi:hypothetical protein
MLSVISGSAAPAQIQAAPPVAQVAASGAPAGSSRTGPDTVTISDAGRQALAAHSSSDGDNDAS